MILQIKEFAQKVVVVAGSSAACGGAGFVIPLLFDRDVGGAFAAQTFGVAGLIAGASLD